MECKREIDFDDEHFEELAAAKTKPGRFRLAFVSNGYHGDIWPLVTLARTLDKECYAVRFFVPENLVDLCVKNGFEAEGVFDDTQAAVKEAGGHGSSYESRVLVSISMNDWFRDGKRIQVNDALDYFEPQLVILGNLWPILACNYEVEKGIPVIPIFYHRFQMQMGLKTWEERIKEVPRPLIYAISDMLDPQPIQSPFVRRVAPLGQSPKGKVEDLQVDLQKFLRRGPAPVAAGWGSLMPGTPGAEELLCKLLRALKVNGKRGVILGGWQNLHLAGQELVETGSLRGFSPKDADLSDFARKKVFFAEHAPYAALLPECCCLVHHGGAGSTQAALRLGCPQVVAPLSLDQNSHSEVVVEMGVGLSLKSLSEMSTRDLTEAIGDVEQLTDAALYVSSLMDSEHGETEVCEIIETFVKKMPQKASPPSLDAKKPSKSIDDDAKSSGYIDGAKSGGYRDDFGFEQEVDVKICA